MIFGKCFQVAIAAVLFFSLGVAANDTIAYGEETTDSTPISEQSPELIAAIHFVRQTGVNRNFKVFLTQAAAVTTTIRGLIATHSADEVRPVLEREILVAISKYGEQWDENLASSYLKFFTSDELKSILKHKRESPYAQKFRTEQTTVGRSMQALSEPLLKDALAEVLLAVFQSFMPDKNE